MPHVLYISQTGMTEPLGQSQVLAYLRGLVRRGFSFDVVAQEPEGTSDDDIARLQIALATERIAYTPLRRSASHARNVKVREQANALWTALKLARQTRPAIVHARSDLPTMVALTVARLVPGCRGIYDCRGLLADEYADFGHWRRDSFNYRALRIAERGLFAAADGVVMLTERARRHVVEEQGWVDRAKPFAVVPCCVDLSRFVVSPEARARSRAALEVNDELVIAYSGTLGEMYCLPEMARLFAAIRQRRRAIFAVFTRYDPAPLLAALADNGVVPGAVRVRSVRPVDMPSALAGADAAMSLIRPTYSKIASSPTKIAEYLAVGLPVALNRNIGDSDALLDNKHLFSDAGDLSEAALESAAESLVHLAEARPVEAAQATARAHFDLELGISRYEVLYRQLLNS